MPASVAVRAAYDAAHANLKKWAEAEKARNLKLFDQEVIAGSALSDKLLEALDADDKAEASNALTLLSSKPGFADLVNTAFVEMFGSQQTVVSQDRHIPESSPTPPMKAKVAPADPAPTPLERFKSGKKLK